jgi:hypothetical protein
MARIKYGQYILTERDGSPSIHGTGVKPVILEGLEDWGGVQHRMKWKFVSKPGVIMNTRHSHEFDEFLIFLSCNPSNELDFIAKIELLLGEEGEPHIIVSPTIVCIPQGLVHGPLTFKSVDKPVLFGYIYLAPDYRQMPAS